MTKQLDMLFIISGKIRPDSPTAGVGVLKSHLAAEGYTSKIIDFNVELYNHMMLYQKSRFYWNSYENAAMEQHNEHDKKKGKTAVPENIWRSYELKYMKENPDPDSWSGFDEFYELSKSKYEELVERIRELNPKWVGISLLAWNTCASVTIKLTEVIRENFPDIKIVWGGGGIYPHEASIIHKTGLFDHYVYGDAEDVICELMKGNFDHPAIDSHKPHQFGDLDEMLFPDFDDIDWSLYDKEISRAADGLGVAHVTGSRGCVRHCDFCDVWMIWPKFRFRSAEKILGEMIHYSEKYNRKFFYFNDSLINGSMKAYRELMHLLATDERAKDLWWHSQFIIRSPRQMTDEDWEITGKTNVGLLEIGVESFSEDVRKEMKKGFTDEHMEFVFEKTKKYDIPIAINIMMGYPFETEEDHQITLNKIQELFDNGHARSFNKNGIPLLSFIPVGMFSLVPNQDTWKKVEPELKDWKNHQEWTFRDNTIEVRKRRQFEILDLISKNLEKYNMPELYLTAKARYKVRKKEKELGLI